ncbi:recombinase family protein [Amedibacterium intestinale]|uniref:recombinase family protein n=1 Tax=Amedibacterium intestinale TaxID=2583452 RepID=UPI000E20A1B5
MEKNIIAIYLRESTKEQEDKGFNIHMQKRKIMEYIKLYDLDGKVEIYQDGFSAKTTNRPNMNRLKEDIRKGQVKTVIVYSLDRLVRRLVGLQEFLELFNSFDVDFISMSENINTKTASGVMVANIIITIAQWEQDTIGERTNNGLVEGAKHGYYMKGQKPFGYNKVSCGDHVKLVLNKEEKRIIHKMRDMLRKGYSMFAIKMSLKEEPYLKSKKIDYCENMLIRILKQKINIGIMELKGVEYKLEVETVFNEEEYAEVLHLLSERTKTSKYNYLFAGKVRNNKGMASLLKSTVKPNNVYLYYYDDISKKRINENYILDKVLLSLKENQTVYKLVRGCTYEKDLYRLTSRKKELKKLLNLVLITSEDYKSELLKVEAEERKVKRYYDKYVLNIHNTFRNMSEEKQETFVWKYVNYINIDYDTKEVMVS